jgi:hypothetical protein
MSGHSVTCHVHSSFFVQINVFSSLGGRDSAARTRFMLDKVMTPRLITHHSFRGRGQKGKIAFTNLPALPDVMLGEFVTSAYFSWNHVTSVKILP